MWGLIVHPLVLGSLPGKEIEKSLFDLPSTASISPNEFTESTNHEPIPENQLGSSVLCKDNSHVNGSDDTSVLSALCRPGHHCSANEVTTKQAVSATLRLDSSFPVGPQPVKSSSRDGFSPTLMVGPSSQKNLVATCSVASHGTLFGSFG